MTQDLISPAASAKQSSRALPIIVMFFLFAMISFVTNLAAPIGTIWGYKFEGNTVLGMMGNMMNFLAYLFMGIPAGTMLVKVGYKKTALWAMAIGVVGLFVQWLSGFVGENVNVFSMTSTVDGVVKEFGVNLNFFIYLLGAFICGFCVCMLNTVVNPMLNLLGGGGNKGNQLLQTGGALNSLSGTLTPFFVGALIGVLTPATTMGNVSLLLWIAMGVFAASFLIISFVEIPEPNLQKDSSKKVEYTRSIWGFRHTLFGVIAIFFYVGIEIGIPGTLNFYLSDQTATGAGVAGEASKIAGAIVAIYWLLMLVGRSCSGIISGKVSTRAQLVAVSSLAIVLVIIAIVMPKSITFEVPSFVYKAEDGSLANVPVSALFLILCGLCTSVMWGGIFNLAVEKLGKYTAKASGVFMMMVVGGGVMPLIQQGIANAAGFMASYWLVVGMLGYILFFSLVGSKVRDMDNEEKSVGEEIGDAL